MSKSTQPKDDPLLEPRDRQDFERMLQQQYELIAASGKLFDAGHLVFALPLSTAIKNVVYEVLVGLGVRDTLLFIDTALHIDPANMLPGNPAHVVQRFSPAPGQPEWAAPGISNLSPARQHPPLRFSDWWGMRLTMDTAKPPHTWSRKDLVMRIRDKDGGSHVDPYRPPESLRALERDGTLGWSRVDPLTGRTTMMNGPLLPSVRQIAWNSRRRSSRWCSVVLDTRHPHSVPLEDVRPRSEAYPPT